MLRPESNSLLQAWIEAMGGTRAAIRTSRPRDYMFGLVAVVLATAARFALDPLLHDRLPYPTYFVAMVLVAWYAPLVPNLVALLASCLAADWFFLDPRGSLRTYETQAFGLATFAISAFVILLMGHARRRSLIKSAQRLELLRVTLGSIGDAVIVTDADARVTYINAVASALTGWQERDARGQPLQTVFPIVNEDTREPLENPAHKALRELRIVGLSNHTVLLGKDGQERPIDDSAAPILDRDGHAIGCVLIFRDITARRLGERLLGASEARKAAVVQNALDAIVTIDGRGRVVEFNPAAVALFGYSADEAIGSELATLLVPAELQQRHRAGLARYLATRQSSLLGERLEMPARHKDGSILLVQLTITVLDAGPEPLFSGFMRDISQEKEAERRVYALVAELKQAARRKDEFLAMLSHELRNPLAPLRLSLEIIKQTQDDPSVREQAWTTMDRQLGHLERLVDDLLDVSRITRDVLELRRGRVELAAIVKQAVEASQPLLLSMRHDLQVRLPAEPVVLDADSVRLVQVFSNLLNNACRYTPAGGRIELVGARDGDEAVVSVRDNGVGIAPEALPRVFEMFMQAERRSDRTAGLGIGLTLVKRLVELHGGRITASSAGRDQGSEFVLRLPLAPVGAAAEPPRPARAPEASRTRRRILVVDDNVDSATGLAIILELSGHEVRLAHDAPEALEIETDFQPDVVLLDIGLPSMSGHDVARRIRGQADGRRVLLLAVTGWGQSEDRRKSAEAGFDHHLVKPIDVQALLEIVAAG